MRRPTWVMDGENISTSLADASGYDGNRLLNREESQLKIGRLRLGGKRCPRISPFMGRDRCYK